MTNVQVDPEGRPLLTQLSEDGFVDCIFRVEDLSTSSAQHSFLMMASYGGRPVGLRVKVRRGMQASFDPQLGPLEMQVYRPAVRFERTGPESDQLLKALATEYGIECADPRIVEHFEFTGVVLHKEEADSDTSPMKIKLFGCDGEDDAEDDYCESFFNLDLGQGFVFWNEKDPDFREPLIRGLSRG